MTSVDTKVTVEERARQSLGISDAVIHSAVREVLLQRFTTLADAEFLANRLEGSVNASFFSLIVDYPMGNGIGGGGTSLPYFLADQVTNPVRLENEYGRILLELGVPGLVIWIAFAFSESARGAQLALKRLDVGRRLALNAVVAYFLTAASGIGMLTSVPQSAFVMLMLGGGVRVETDSASPTVTPYVGASTRQVLLVPDDRSQA